MVGFIVNSLHYRTWGEKKNLLPHSAAFLLTNGMDLVQYDPGIYAHQATAHMEKVTLTA